MPHDKDVVHPYKYSIFGNRAVASDRISLNPPDKSRRVSTPTDTT